MSRLLAILTALCLAAQAATAQTDPGQQILDEQRRAEEQRQAEAAGGSTLPEAPEARPVPEEVCFPITRIELSGTSDLAPDELSEIIPRFTGQCIGQASIGALINGISAAYAEAGLITTRAYVPAQDIASGILKVDVIEGRIESFVYQRVDEGSPPASGPPRKVRWAFPGQPGDVFQLRELEHGLENMNRVGGIQAAANLTAGVEPGTTRVALSEQRTDRFRGTLGADNRGSEATGKARVRFTLEMDDLLDINDATTLSYSGAENSNALALSVSVPYRYWRISAYGSYSESLSELTEVSDLFTQTASASFELERMIFRDDKRQFSLYGSAGSYWNERFINIVGLTPQQHSTLRLGAKYRHQFETASVSGNLSIAAGSPIFGADWDIGNLPDDAPVANFYKLEGQLTYQRPFENGMTLSLSATGQYTTKPLFSNEQIGLGGWDTVRGYEGQQISGDAGAYLRTDIYLPAIRFGTREEAETANNRSNQLFNLSGYVQPYAFADIGFVRSIAAEETSRMAGFGVGISASVDRITVQAAAAVPVIDQDSFEKDNIQGLLNVSVKLF